MKQFYVYVHCRLTGEPFYVGKGQRKRAYDFKNYRNTHYKNLILKHGKENVRVFVRNCVSEQQAFEHEIWMIAWCKAQGFRLCNYSIGGEGSSGYTMPAEVRLKISRKVKEIFNTPEKRAERSRKGKGNQNCKGKHWKLSEENKQRHRGHHPNLGNQFRLNKKHTIETKNKIKLAWLNPETYQLKCDAMRKGWVRKKLNVVQ
jgi:hypothetical protein